MFDKDLRKLFFMRPPNLTVRFFLGIHLDLPNLLKVIQIILIWVK